MLTLQHFLSDKTLSQTKINQTSNSY